MSGRPKARGQRGLGQASLALLDRIQGILAERAPMTVRGICYKLFVDGWLSSMQIRNTQKISRLTVWARMRTIEAAEQETVRKVALAMGN